ncbi:MAG: class I SAM-dependent methyltransferase [Terracoccus sp.]
MTTGPDGANARTLAAYEQRATVYRDRTGHRSVPAIDAMVKAVSEDSPPGEILEIGSAHGRDALTIESRGRTVRRTDATVAFVQMLREQGHRADVLNVLTDELTNDEHPTYAAVLANAVFLHFTPAELAVVLTKVRAALTEDGLLAFSVKRGDGSEWSDHKLGVPRFFQYWQPEPLAEHVEAAGLTVRDLAVDPANPREWVRVVARAAFRRGMRPDRPRGIASRDRSAHDRRVLAAGQCR